MPSTFHRDRFTWLAYFLLALYGFFLNILGPITPFLKDELNLTYTVSSLHFTAFAVGLMLVGFIGYILIDRLGHWRALWTGAFGLGIGAVILVAGRTAVVTVGAAFAMGLVGSLILVIVPSALSEEHGELRAVALSEANVVASLVAAAAPLLVGWAALAGNWRWAMGLAALAPLGLFLGFRRVPVPQSAEKSISVSPGRKSLPARYWVYWTGIVLAVSVEFCMIFWGADYMETILGMAKSGAAQSVSLFLAGMIVGRLAASRLVQYFSARGVVAASVLVSGLGFMIFWMAGSATWGLMGLFVTGLGVAGLYPLLLSLAIGTAEDAVQASARATLASGSAILALPLVLGRLADSYGIHLAYIIVGFLLIGILFILLFTRKPGSA